MPKPLLLLPNPVACENSEGFCGEYMLSFGSDWVGGCCIFDITKEGARELAKELAKERALEEWNIRI